MCNFWSCVLTRDGKVLWDPAITSHEELVSKFQLADTKLKDREFVRIEITPPNNDVLNRKQGDWRFKVDEEGTLPDWFANDPIAQNKIVWREWKKMVKQMDADFRSKGLDFLRKDRIIERVNAMKPGEATVSRRSVHSALGEYVKLLKAQDQQHREWDVKEVRFYTPKEWDSVRASVWDSVWASVWDSVRDSVWASVWASVQCSLVRDDEQNPFLPLSELAALGVYLYGVADDGTAYVWRGESEEARS